MTKYLSNVAKNFLDSIQTKEVVIQVHSGVFHADDVATVALLSTLVADVAILRDFKIHEDARIVADVGMKHNLDGEQLMFDHHQDGLELRADGTKPSALGLVADWLLDPALRAKLDRYITPVERQDNGQELREGEVNIFAFVASFNKCWNEFSSQDDLFHNVEQMAIAVWKRIFAQLEAEAEATEIVADAIANAKDGFAVLAKGGMPWQALVVKHNEEHEDKILRVGYMDLARGQFNVQAVPDALGSRGMLQPLPEQWLGEDKPEGLIFCHQARFLAAFKDEESARKALAAEA